MSEKVQSIFVSIDPERDNIERINEYLSNFNQNILGLTGDVQKIDDIKRKFRVYVKLNKRNSDDKDYLVDHTGYVYLIGRDGAFLTMFRGGSDPKKMAQTIASYIDGKV